MSQLVALIGPTAVGKTDLAIELTQQLDAEILGCDSMQVYRGMSRLTDQPTAQQRAQVPHHLIDCLDPEETCNVGRYRRLALDAMQSIQARGQSVLIVGGTGLYLKALTDGFCEAPAADPRVRDGLWAQVEAEGVDALYARLQAVDPVAAEKIHPHNARRVVRALEVYEMTGVPLSDGWRWSTGAQETRPITVIGVTRDRDVLTARINDRVARMMSDEALIEEVRQLRQRRLSVTAQQVHGLRLLEAYLDGAATREQTIEQWQQQVRRYAKRQRTWFRADSRIRWIEVASEETTDSIIQRILGSVL